jgi:homoserine kinase
MSRRRHRSSGARPAQAAAAVRVRAPATSANLGPGFDAAGLALQWWDTLEARPAAATALRLAAEPPGGRLDQGQLDQQLQAIPTGPANLVRRALQRLADEVGAALPALDLAVGKGFPPGRGFGSSAAAVALGLLAGRALLAPDLPDARLLALGTELEGHPDNLAPCLAGGATLCWHDGDRVHSARVPVHPELAALALVAPEPMATGQARALLPAQVPFGDAARTAARAALLAPALAGEFDLLLPATDDVLHQPPRLACTPAAAAALARLRGGGHAAFLSGAGPSLLVLCSRERLAAACALAEAALDGAAGWRVQPLDLAVEGARCEPLPA